MTDEPTLAPHGPAAKERLAMSPQVMLTIFGTALVVRILNLVFTGDLEAYAMVEDSKGYWQIAADWMANGSFGYATPEGYVEFTERVPGYFLFLIPFKFLFGDAYLPVILVQSVLDAGTCLVIALLGSQVNVQTGIVSGLIAAVTPNLVIHSGLILTDSLFLFVFTSLLWFALKFLASGKMSLAVIAGLICGVAIMTRPIVQFIPIAMAFSAPFIVRYYGGTWRRGIATALLVVLAASVICAPLVVRNLISHQSASLTSQSGTHLLFWVASRAISAQDGRPFEKVSASLGEKYLDLLRERGFDANDLIPFEASRLKTELALSELAKLPVPILMKAWVQGAVVNLGAPAVVLDPRLRAHNRSSFYNAAGSGLFERVSSFLENNGKIYVGWIVAGGIGIVVSSILSLYGAWRLFQHSPWGTVFAALTILYFLLIMGPVGSPKYRIPFEPVLIVFQSLGLVSILKIWPYFRDRWN